MASPLTLPVAPVLTDRLELRPLTAADIAAFRHGRRAELEAALDARFGTLFVPPPLLADALPFMEARLHEHPEELGWWTWIVLRREDRRALGSIGFGGRPDADGAIVIGYSTYPDAHGRGYATEAALGLLGWAFAHPAVQKVCATIPGWNASSRRVAEKIGMTHAGLIWEEELGDDVELWSVERPGPSN